MRWYLGGERHCESRLYCPGTEHNVPERDLDPNWFKSQVHLPWGPLPDCEQKHNKKMLKARLWCLSHQQKLLLRISFQLRSIVHKPTVSKNVQNYCSLKNFVASGLCYCRFIPVPKGKNWYPYSTVQKGAQNSRVWWVSFQYIYWSAKPTVYLLRIML